MIPAIVQRKIIIATEASNFQKIKEILTGAAFWRAKIAISMTIKTAITIVTINIAPCLLYLIR